MKPNSVLSTVVAKQPPAGAVQAGQIFGEDEPPMMPASPAVSLPSEAVLILRPDGYEFSSDGDVEIAKQKISQKDGRYFVTLEIAVRAVLLLACLGLASCAGYTGSITVGYTGTTPSGKPYTIGVSVPIQRQEVRPATVPVAQSGKAVSPVLP